MLSVDTTLREANCNLKSLPPCIDENIEVRFRPPASPWFNTFESAIGFENSMLSVCNALVDFLHGGALGGFALSHLADTLLTNAGIGKEDPLTASGAARIFEGGGLKHVGYGLTTVKGQPSNLSWDDLSLVIIPLLFGSDSGRPCDPLCG